MYVYDCSNSKSIFTIEPGADVESYDVSKLSSEVLQNMEADTFWCTTKLLDGIQDNYTFAQPGVQTKVQKLQKLNENIDGKCNVCSFLHCD